MRMKEKKNSREFFAPFCYPFHNLILNNLHNKKMQGQGQAQEARVAQITRAQSIVLLKNVGETLIYVHMTFLSNKFPNH
jgi:hypothetical protein